MFHEPIEYYVRHPFEQQRVIHISELVLKSAPNKLHKDGRIYFEDEQGNYVAITVSPLHTDFATQVEQGVWPLVKAFVDKGYLTTSSCEGHDGSDYFVKLVFNGRQSAEQFVEQLPKIAGLQTTIQDQSANVVRYIEHGTVKYRQAFPDENISKFEEVTFINMLFNRQYTDCCYVTIRIYPRLASFNPFKHIKYRKDKAKNLESSKELLVNYVTTELPYYSL